MQDNAVESLRRLVESTEGGRFAVANAIHANEQTLYQILTGVPLRSGKKRTVGRDLRERLDRHFPGWNSHPADDGQAHDVSLQPIKVPNRLSWEQAMTSAELPPHFVIEMPDDALSPSVARGTGLIFSRSADPQPGLGVFVQDKGGRRFVRRYAEGLAGAWQAQALNTAYATFESGRDGLKVLAVMTGRLDGTV
jgi:hypothetical protein